MYNVARVCWIFLVGGISDWIEWMFSFWRNRVEACFFFFFFLVLINARGKEKERDLLTRGWWYRVVKTDRDGNQQWRTAVVVLEDKKKRERDQRDVLVHRWRHLYFFGFLDH